MLIFIDRHNILGTLHTSEVLNRSTNTAGDVERWLDRLTGLTDLIAVGQPTGINNGTRGTGSTTQRGCQFFHKVVIIGFAQTATTTDDHAGLFQSRSFARYLDAIQYLDCL